MDYVDGDESVLWYQNDRMRWFTTMPLRALMP